MGPPAQDAAASSSPSSGGSSRGSSRRSGGPRLERRNASKHIPYQYDQELYCSYPPSSPRASSGPAASTAPASLACSVDLSSFRIGGSGDGGGDVQLLCRNLGLSGPDDFAISITDWEAHKAYRSSSASTSPSSSSRSKPDRPQPRESPLRPDPAEEVPAFSLATDFELPPKKTAPIEPPARPAWLDPARPDARKPACEGGIKGVRPPPVTLKPQPTMLKPPPSMARLPKACLAGSTWDILQSFAPEDAQPIRSARDFGCEDAEDEEDEAEVLTLDDLRLGDTSEEFTGMSSISTTNDDETADPMFYISPNGRFKRKIRSWSRGMLLGSGSFGTVYEGISDEGVFFAVKEVPLHDQGSNAQQCIFQLEQEIALLSQFEHENIVHYYGTDKEDSKLYIFLELVTQGSLVSLYRKYRLRDTHVSAYTRQILNGLTYLHERDIVHRDIKCANILVHANGSVKLADFGLAKQASKLNVLKSCKGTVYWMAPEVVNPKKTYGPAADIWSLGCTVLEMLTRELPYPDLEWTQALYRIGKGEPPAIPSTLSKDARNFISQCVKPNPEDRPSASKLLDHPFVNRSIRSVRSMRTSSRPNSSTRGVIG
ncbi:mitogen-activated protein kinase kinase kinase 1-like [Lolium rigidum]|uniref:mitogen-activated protein kinase kinase kinase 1-like n=1 Tax=Lolium rigidum TaxID=89674 RepID=UPI001F5DABF5|nr:mitogen-activated protein kinase kinase kinase 1-like [Lolium rigidum]XP_047089996.1 mitogen-activated protein kinase kinase kinase 1-like [Lolium rigidum]